MKLLCRLISLCVALMAFTIWGSAHEVKITVNLIYPDGEEITLDDEGKDDAMYSLTAVFRQVVTKDIEEQLAKNREVSMRDLSTFAVSGLDAFSSLVRNQTEVFTRTVNLGVNSLTVRPDVTDPVMLVALVRVIGRNSLFPYKGQALITNIEIDKDQEVHVDVHLTRDEDLLPRRSGEVAFRVLSSITNEPLSGWAVKMQPATNRARRTDGDGRISLYIENLAEEVRLLVRQGNDYPPQVHYMRSMRISTTVSAEQLQHAYENERAIEIYTEQPLLAFRYFIEEDGVRTPFSGHGRMVYSLDYGQPRPGRRTSYLIVESGVSAIYPYPVGFGLVSRHGENPNDRPFIEDLRSVNIHEYQLNERITMNIEEIDWATVFSKDARPPYIVDVTVTKVGDSRAYMIPVIDSDTARPITNWQAEFTDKYVEASDQWQLRSSPDGKLQVSNLPWQRISVAIRADGYGDQELIIGASGYDGEPVRMTPLNKLYLHYDVDLPVTYGSIIHMQDLGDGPEVRELEGAVIATEDGSKALHINRVQSLADLVNPVAVLFDAQENIIAVQNLELGPERRIDARVQVTEQKPFAISIELQQETVAQVWPVHRSSGLPLSPKEPGAALGGKFKDEHAEFSQLHLQWAGQPIDIYVYNPKTDRYALVHSIEESPTDKLHLKLDLDAADINWLEHVDSPWNSIIEHWRDDEE